MHLALRLLLVAALVLSGMAPRFVALAGAGDEAPVTWTLPDGSDLAICHALPGDTGGQGQNQAIHCGKCVMVGHALALPAAVPLVGSAFVCAGPADWPAPIASPVAPRTPGVHAARAPPVEA